MIIKSQVALLATRSLAFLGWDLYFINLHYLQRHQETNISHLGKRKIIFKSAVVGDMLPRRVNTCNWFHSRGVNSLSCNGLNACDELTADIKGDLNFMGFKWLGGPPLTFPRCED